MANNSFPAGLYVAATPIGHLDDISQRVRDALTRCDRIYAEDTRRTQTLLHALGIARDRAVLHALHEHNEYTVRDDVIAAIELGASVLMVSDAGTPAISDPGFLVVDTAWAHGIPISPLPGPSAVITALSVCGFARWPMCFWGFAPAKASARRSWLENLASSGGLAVIFEAPHRADASLTDCAAVFGDSTPMLYARELTKQHETLLRGSIRDIQHRVAKHQRQDPGAAKGEMVWVFDLGEKKTVSADHAQLMAWADALRGEMPAANAAKCLMKMCGVTRDEAYQAILGRPISGVSPCAPD